ncbi:response regulator receiver domain-containing protein [Campylobacter mucosalis]|uniref:response regulator n=1 Tax=Campylobacter mucosalis TaxID=202 RepID=UPI00159319D2|nr:response regulator [Campylobacter mucosalis]QKF62589.1 response regulator receiver domain-containing protein [Campylobacter mucosalis]
MNASKKYALLLPVIMALAVSIYGVYICISRLYAADRFEQEILLQDAYKKTMVSLLKEMVLVRNLTQSGANVKNSIELYDLIAQTDKYAKIIIDKKPENSSLILQIENIRNTVSIHDRGKIYYNFYLYIGEVMKNGYTNIKYSDNLNINLNIYLSLIRGFYDYINYVIEDRFYIFQAKSALELATKQVMGKWLSTEYLIDLSRFKNIPTPQIKQEVLDITNSSKYQDMVKDIKTLRKDMLLDSDEEYKVSKNELELIYDISRGKFLMLTEISDVIEKGMLFETNYFKKQLRIYMILFTLSAILFGVTLVKLFGNLKILAEAIRQAKTTQNELEFKISGKNELKETILHLSRAYVGLYDSHKHYKNFNEIKNNYLRMILENNKKRSRENMQSLSFLRKNLQDNDKIKAVSFLEENLSRIFLNLNNIKNIINFEENSIRLNENSAFYPQILFKRAIEANMSAAREKDINYITYIDPRIQNELEGDKYKIQSAISNIIAGAISQCAQYSKVIVEIKQEQDKAENDIANISVSIRNNANLMDSKKINDILNINSDITMNTDTSDFWFAVSNVYLKIINSELNIRSVEGLGNEFYFNLRLKTKSFLDAIGSINRDLKIAFLEDQSQEYNDFFKRILQNLGLSFKTYVSDKNIGSEHEYDMVFMRENDTEALGVKNIIKLKDPLCSSDILEALEKNITEKGGQKFVFTRPRVLVLEDNSINANIFKFMLNDYILDVTFSNKYSLNGNNARNNYDIVFIDTSLPGVDALDMVEKFKSNELNSHLPIIGFISNTSSISHKQASEVFNHVLKKPFSKKELLDTLVKFIPYMQNFIKTQLDVQHYMNEADGILLYKKTALENKIFAGALSDFSTILTTANNINEFKQNLENKAFDIVFVDESESLSMDEIVNLIELSRAKFNSDIRLFIFSKNQSSDLGSKYYIKFLSPQISKTQLANIVRQNGAMQRERERERERENENINDL